MTNDKEKVERIWKLLKDTPMEYVLQNPLLLKTEKIIDEE